MTEDKKKSDDFGDSDRAELEAEQERRRKRHAAIDHIVEEHGHRQWLVGLAKRWATWIAAVVLGAKYGWDALSDLIKKLAE